MAEFSGQWLLPLVYAVGFVWVMLVRRRYWAATRAVAALGLILTLVVLGTLLIPAVNFGAVDKLGLTVALLISLLGWVIVNYSWRYLQGEANQLRFVRAILFTLACVSLLVVSQHLLIIALAWCGTSVGLHYLLTFYRERKAAVIVAHKKFIASRMADFCLIVAMVLIFNATGTLSLSGLGEYIQNTSTLSTGLHVAAVMIAMSAILKSAQLPMHGWLIQVMEAPTPVSALLHAGVVNIGGFVLIRLSELISQAPAAQWLLVIIGGGTAVLAGLVMMTRISIKVRLAWSTCAQMGFMLMEVGLGLYELALLHLVAHSLYKAHAFLAAGETVAETRANAFSPRDIEPRSPLRYVLAAFQSGVIVAASFVLWTSYLPSLQLPLVAIVIITLGLAALLWFEQGATLALVLRGWLKVVALTQLYLIWHVLFAGLVAPTDTHSILELLAIVGFVLLYVIQVCIRCYPSGSLARQFFAWAYSGFYVDETFTRLTFKFWPARLSPIQAQTQFIKQPHQSGEWR